MDYHHLLEATGIVVSGVLFYSLAYGWFAPDDPRRRPLWVIALGLVWGAIAVVLMISRIQTTEGPFVDGRAIPIALIGLFEGWEAGLIAGLAAVAYRIYLGGGGATAGVVAILAVAVARGLAHRWAGGTERVRIHHAFVLAVGTFFITFGAFELRGEPGRTLFARVWPSYLLLTVVGLPMLALLMQSIVERRLLAQERERFRAVLDDATDAVRIVDADTQRILDCNRADCDLSGFARDAMLGRDSRQFWPESGVGPRRPGGAVARGAGNGSRAGVERAVSDRLRTDARGGPLAPHRRIPGPALRDRDLPRRGRAARGRGGAAGGGVSSIGEPACAGRRPRDQQPARDHHGLQPDAGRPAGRRERGRHLGAHQPQGGRAHS